MNMMILKNVLLFLGIDNENCELEVSGMLKKKVKKTR